MVSLSKHHALLRPRRRRVLTTGEFHESEGDVRTNDFVVEQSGGMSISRGRRRSKANVGGNGPLDDYDDDNDDDDYDDDNDREEQMDSVDLNRVAQQPSASAEVAGTTNSTNTVNTKDDVDIVAMMKGIGSERREHDTTGAGLTKGKSGGGGLLDDGDFEDEDDDNEAAAGGHVSHPSYTTNTMLVTRKSSTVADWLQAERDRVTQGQDQSGSLSDSQEEFSATREHFFLNYVVDMDLVDSDDCDSDEDNDTDLALPIPPPPVLRETSSWSTNWQRFRSNFGPGRSPKPDDKKGRHTQGQRVENQHEGNGDA